MTDFNALIHDHVDRLFRSQMAQLERDLAAAIVVQEFDKLDRLHTVFAPDVPPAVASFWHPPDL